MLWCAQARVQVAAEAMRPFGSKDASGALDLDISFSVNGTSYKYALALPITLLAYCEALPSDKASKPVTPALMDYIRSTLVPAMHLGLAEGLDNEKTVTGSLTFVTGEDRAP